MHILPNVHIFDQVKHYAVKVFKNCHKLFIQVAIFSICLQSAHVNDQEGASAVSFDTLPQSSLEEMVQGQGAATYLASYDETALCSTSFR